LAIASFCTAASGDKDNYTGEVLALCSCRQDLSREHRPALQDITFPTEASLGSSVCFAVNKQKRRSFFFRFSSVNS
jgi:hypothetical protein